MFPSLPLPAFVFRHLCSCVSVKKNMFLLTKDKVIMDRAQHVYVKENVQQPPSGTQIFCSNLPRNMLAVELFPYFAIIGEIYEFRLMMEFSGFSRGFCFVTYMDEAHANQAVRIMHGFILKDRELCVYKSWDNTKLFIFGIPSCVPPEQIKDELKILFPGITNVTSKYDERTGTWHKGWVFLEFDNHRNASACRKQIWPNKLMAWGSTIRAEWARPKRAPDLRNDCSLVFQNIDANLNKNEVYEIVKSRLKGASLLQIYKKVGCTTATLEFSSPQGANVGLKHLKGLKLNDQKIMIKKKQDSQSGGFESGTTTSPSDNALLTFDITSEVANASGSSGDSENAFAQAFAEADDYNQDYFNDMAQSRGTNFKDDCANDSYSFDDLYHDLFPDDPHYKPIGEGSLNLQDYEDAYTSVVTFVNSGGENRKSLTDNEAGSKR